MPDHRDISLIDKTIENIQVEYLKDNVPWYLAFSGGKDSSALLKLVFNAIVDLKNNHKPITIVYCSTGVEIPIVESFVKESLQRINQEAELNHLPFKSKIVYPEIKDSFFSKVIGRGYPPPTNKFRWCTDVLRIRPFNKYIKPNTGRNVVLLGTRKGESAERDKILNKYATDNNYYYKQYCNANIMNYSPIVDYSVEDIWMTINNMSLSNVMDMKKLTELYQLIGLRKIKYNDSSIFPIRSRFGCWTCTVIRKDNAMKNLIDNGYLNMLPLFEFRNWLVSIRDDPYRRFNKRRNGQSGLGPFTIEARKEIFTKLLHVQDCTKFEILNELERLYIQQQWESDLYT